MRAYEFINEEILNEYTSEGFLYHQTDLNVASEILKENVLRAKAVLVGEHYFQKSLRGYTEQDLEKEREEMATVFPLKRKYLTIPPHKTNIPDLYGKNGEPAIKKAIHIISLSRTLIEWEGEIMFKFYAEKVKAHNRVFSKIEFQRGRENEEACIGDIKNVDKKLHSIIISRSDYDRYTNPPAGSHAEEFRRDFDIVLKHPKLVIMGFMDYDDEPNISASTGDYWNMLAALKQRVELKQKYKDQGKIK
jgi:hypothetical protein